MTASRCMDCTARRRPQLYGAFELGWSEWKLAFSPGAGVPARLRSVGARSRDAQRSTCAARGTHLATKKPATFYNEDENPSRTRTGRLGTILRASVRSSRC